MKDAAAIYESGLFTTPDAFSKVPSGFQGSKLILRLLWFFLSTLGNLLNTFGYISANQRKKKNHVMSLDSFSRLVYTSAM